MVADNECFFYVVCMYVHMYSTCSKRFFCTSYKQAEKLTNVFNQNALVICMYNMPAQLSTNSSIPKYHLIVAFLEQSTGVNLVTVIGNWFSPLAITVQLKANGNQKYSRIMER